MKSGHIDWIILLSARYVYPSDFPSFTPCVQQEIVAILKDLAVAPYTPGSDVAQIILAKIAFLARRGWVSFSTSKGVSGQTVSTYILSPRGQMLLPQSEDGKDFVP